MAKIRLNLRISERLSKELEEIAKSSGGDLAEVFRRAFALIKIAHQARRDGRYLGLVSDRSKLDTELIGIL